MTGHVPMSKGDLGSLLKTPCNRRFLRPRDIDAGNQDQVDAVCACDHLYDTHIYTCTYTCTLGSKVIQSISTDFTRDTQIHRADRQAKLELPSQACTSGIIYSVAKQIHKVSLVDVVMYHLHYKYISIYLSIFTNILA